MIKLQTEDQTLQFLERGAGVSRGVVREVLNHRLCVAHPNIVQVRLLPGWLKADMPRCGAIAAALL